MISSLALPYLMLAMLFAWPPQANAEPDHQSERTAEAERWEQLGQLLARSPKPESVRAVFTQKRTSLLLDEPVVSHGRFIAKGQTARLSLTQPSPVEMRFNGQVMQIFYPDDNVLEVYRIPRNGIAMTAGRPDPATLAQNFRLNELSTDRSDGRVTLVLEPRGDTRQHLQRLTLGFDPKLGLIVSASSTDAVGDQTDMQLTQVETNSEVKDQDIALEVPDDARIEYPEGKPEQDEGR